MSGSYASVHGDVHFCIHIIGARTVVRVITEKLQIPGVRVRGDLTRDYTVDIDAGFSGNDMNNTTSCQTHLCRQWSAGYS